MAITQLYTAIPNDVITAARWNNEFGNIYNNAVFGSIVATGSTAERSLEDRLAQEYWVEDFGAVGDGVTDDSTEIQAAINAVGAAGGGVLHFDSKVYAIATGLTCVYDNVLLQGAGQGYTTSRPVTQDYLSAATTLLWTGAAGGTVLTIGPTPSSTFSLIGGGVIGIFIEGDLLAAIGLLLRSVNNAMFDIVIEDCTTVGLDLQVESTIAGGPGTQSNWFRRVVVIQQDATSGICVRLDGNTVVGFNTSLNIFGNLTLLHRDGVALQLRNCDGNVFQFVRIFRHASGTAKGVTLQASNTANDYTRHNTFMFLQPNAGGVTAQGTATGSNASTNNVCLSYSLDNSSVLPTVEFGASFSYSTTFGRMRQDRADGNALLQIIRSSNTAGQQIGKVEWLAYDNAGTPAEIVYANIDALNRTVTAGATDGTIRLFTMNAGTTTAQLLASNGVLIGASPTGSYLGVGSVNAASDYYKNGANLTAREVVTYSASMTPNQRNGHAHTITITNGTAFTINNPTNSVDGDIVRITLRNTSGGAHGVITWGAGYKMAGALAAIATANSRTVEFLYDGTNWVETFRSAADVPN